MLDLNKLESLSPQQRIDMIMHGMSPLDSNQVSKYLKGIGISENEKLERVKRLYEDVSTNLGGGKEQIISAGQEITPGNLNGSGGSTDYRKMIESDFESSNFSGKVFNPTIDDFNIPGRNIYQQQKKKKLKEQQDLQLGKIAQEGFDFAKEYLNQFIINLQESDVSTSLRDRIKLFNLLKNCIKKESKYKNNVAQIKQYRHGVLQAEKAMFNKLRN